MRCIRDTLSKKFCGMAIAVVDVDLVRFALRHESKIRTESIDVLVL